MRSTMRVVAGCMLFLLAAVPLAAAPEGYRDALFCDLMAHSDLFNGQSICVRATYRVGLEWAYLYCPACDGRVWVEFVNRDDMDRDTRINLKKVPKDAGEVTGTFCGKFQVGSYGHLSAYKSQITVGRVRDIRTVVRGMGLPSKQIREKCSAWCAPPARP